MIVTSARTLTYAREILPVNPQTLNTTKNSDRPERFVGCLQSRQFIAFERHCPLVRSSWSQLFHVRGEHL